MPWYLWPILVADSLLALGCCAAVAYLWGMKETPPSRPTDTESC